MAQKFLLMLWVKMEEGVMWFESVVENKQGFLMKQGVLTHCCIHLLLLYTKEVWREKAQICSGLHVDANLSALN